MNEITTNLIVFAVIGSLIGLLFVFLYLRKQKKQTQLSNYAREKGWLLETISEPLASGFRLSGDTSKGNWTMESVARSSGTDAGPGSSNVHRQTTWWSNALCKDKLSVVLGPKFSSMMSSSFLSKGNPLRDAALRALLGDGAKWISNLEPVDVSALGLADRYLLLSDRPDAVRESFNPGIVEKLNKLSKDIQPVIIYGNDRLEMRLNDRQLQEPADFESFIGLGKALIDDWCQ